MAATNSAPPRAGPLTRAGTIDPDYFLTGVGIDDFPCAPPKGTAGAAGLVWSFFGFFCSRLLRICPLAIRVLLKVRVFGRAGKRACQALESPEPYCAESFIRVGYVRQMLHPIDVRRT